jgi:phage host-nuclease inhibitor protein Gam
MGGLREEVRAEAVGLRGEMAGLREEVRAEAVGLRGEMGGLREEVRGGAAGLREEMAGLREEVRAEAVGLREEMGGLREEVRAEAVGLRGELRGEVQRLEHGIEAAAAETRRHFDVTAEALRQDIRTIAEGVSTLSDRVERLGAEIRAEMDGRFRAAEAVTRLAFAGLRRDIDSLRSR